MTGIPTTTGTIGPPKNIRQRKPYGYVVCSALLVLSAGLACSKKYNYLKVFSKQVGRTSSYDEAYNKWTKDGQIDVLDEMTTLIRVSVTYRSKDYNAAYQYEMQRMRGWTDKRRDDEIDKFEIETTDSLNFFFIAETASLSDNSFGSPDDAWRLILNIGENCQILDPTVVRRPKISAIERRLFPFFKQRYFAKLYQVSFPKQCDNGTMPVLDQDMSLHIYGPRGSVELRWPFEAR